jgi:protein-tyrosine-phosphatase
MASDGSGRMRFAMVCASNNNRSMEAHLVFQAAGMRVESYGVGGHVKLPGATQKSPNAYDFGTPYTEIHDDLQRRDAALYERNGLLTMLKRNIKVLPAPPPVPAYSRNVEMKERRSAAGEEGTGEVAARDDAVRRSSDFRGVGVR